MMEDLCFRSIIELADLIRTRQITPVELTKSFIQRIEELEPRINAFITVTREDALASAHQAEKEVMQGTYRGPLHGIPVGIKDLYNTKGIRTTSGSTIFKDFVPNEDSTVVQRLKNAGAVVIGKLMMTEFAFGAQGKNEHYGSVRNPWNTEYITGGSSTGSGASVGAAECPLSLGSDTGGSVRVPASLCGVVGLKPTYGLISRFGMTELSWSLDHVGPLARTVEGVAAALQVLAAYDPKDPTSVNGPQVDYVASLNSTVEGLRIGIPKEYAWDIVDAEVESVVRTASDQLESLGASVEEASVPHMEDMGLVMSTIIPADAATVHRSMVLSRGHEYDSITRLHLESGLFISAADYVKAMRLRSALNREIHGAFRQADVLVMPTAPVAAQPYSAETVKIGSTEIRVRFLLSRITRVFNPGGFPAVSVPCGFTSQGLPIGLQVVGRPFEDATVLRVAHAYQQATQWHLRRPPL